MNRLTDQVFRAPSGVFTAADLTVLLGGTGFSRQALVKRALAGGEILKIRRGLYCLAPSFQKKPISVHGLAQRVSGPSYISMESALAYHGWIPEAVTVCTNASLGNRKVFETPVGVFLYRRVPQQTFYLGVERRRDEQGNVFFMASPAKALADYVYVHHRPWLGLKEPAGSLRIDEALLAGVKREELKDLLENYRNGRVKRFLKAWMAEVGS